MWALLHSSLIMMEAAKSSTARAAFDKVVCSMVNPIRRLKAKTQSQGKYKRQSLKPRCLGVFDVTDVVFRCSGVLTRKAVQLTKAITDYKDNTEPEGDVGND